MYITVRQLQASWCGALSLTRGLICHLSSRTAFSASYIGSARTTHRKHIKPLSNGYHILLSGVSTHELPSNGRPIVAYSLLWYMFTGLLPSNGRHSIVGFALVGTCLAILLLEMAQPAPPMSFPLISSGMTWAVHVARMGETCIRVLVGKSEGKGPLDTPRLSRENIHIDLIVRELGREAVDWIHLA
jgi:hypothetical protein